MMFSHPIYYGQERDHRAVWQDIYVMHEGVLISSFAIHAIHPCMPALYVADVASDAIGELYSSHTYVVEPGYVPDYENNRL